MGFHTIRAVRRSTKNWTLVYKFLKCKNKMIPHNITECQWLIAGTQTSARYACVGEEFFFTKNVRLKQKSTEDFVYRKMVDEVVDKKEVKIP